MNPLWCAHPRGDLSEVDEKGDAVCAKCGSTVSVVLTREKFMEAWERAGRSG